jgi:cell division protein FtsB
LLKIGLQKLRQNTTSQRALVLSLIFSAVAYNLYFCCQIKQREIEERMDELHSLQSQISLAEYRNIQLKAQVAHLSTDAGAEEVARQKLGLVKPGEMAFVVMGAPAASATPAPLEVPQEKTSPGMVMRFMHWLLLS